MQLDNYTDLVGCFNGNMQIEGGVKITCPLRSAFIYNMNSSDHKHPHSIIASYMHLVVTTLSQKNAKRKNKKGKKPNSRLISSLLISHYKDNSLAAQTFEAILKQAKYNKIRSIKRGFVLSSFFSIYHLIKAENIVRFIEDCVIQRFVISSVVVLLQWFISKPNLFLFGLFLFFPFPSYHFSTPMLLQYSISEFPSGLCIKTRLSAQPFIWK